MTATPNARAPVSTALVHSMVFRLGTIGLNAATGVVTARALHPAGRGELAAIVLWPMLASGLTTIGLPSALVYHLRREPGDARTLVGSAALLATVATAAGIAIGWWLIPWWLAQHSAATVRAAQWCLLTTHVCSLTLVGRAAWEARGDFAASALSQMVTPAVVLAGLAILAMSRTLTTGPAAAIYVLAGVPSLLWMWTSLARRASLSTGRPAIWQRLTHYGVRSYGVDLCGVLAVYLDQVLVVGLLSVEAMGIYAVALSLSRVLGAVHASVAAIAFPRAVGLAPDAMMAQLGRAARLGTIVAGVLGLGIVVTSPALLGALYGHAYLVAVPLLPILVLEAMTAGLVQVLLQGFLAAGRPGLATAVVGVGVAGSLPLFLWLVPAYGVMGAAIALLSASVLRLLLTLGIYRHVLAWTPPRISPARTDLVDLAQYARARVGALAGRSPVGGAS